MTLAPLRDALCTLHQAFRVPEIVTGRQDITIELPLEAGLRFEMWLRDNAPTVMRCDPSWISRPPAAATLFAPSPSMA